MRVPWASFVKGGQEWRVKDGVTCSDEIGCPCELAGWQDLNSSAKNGANSAASKVGVRSTLNLSWKLRRFWQMCCRNTASLSGIDPKLV